MVWAAEESEHPDERRDNDVRECRVDDEQNQKGGKSTVGIWIELEDCQPSEHDTDEKDEQTPGCMEKSIYHKMYYTLGKVLVNERGAITSE